MAEPKIRRRTGPSQESAAFCVVALHGEENGGIERCFQRTADNFPSSLPLALLATTPFLMKPCENLKLKFVVGSSVASTERPRIFPAHYRSRGGEWLLPQNGRQCSQRVPVHYRWPYLPLLRLYGSAVVKSSNSWKQSLVFLLYLWIS